ncbi:MAG: 50S ribosomal protein L9 [Desulfotomaculum sp. 46_296]|nr:MAG: 50S ribosomal protein L9 [Desulfotomaculum sp. 46_296]KUK84666.1 MAG: 50S ribosomal protein L9 [Desulfofundulus kuznetsovii]HAU31083.1 50S ribosomal protein L9 [Desulfotomaculum sp.]
MKVILLEDVKNLGKKGDLVQVAEGHARNYLLPRKLAVEATEGKIKQLAELQEAAARKKQREESEAKDLACRLESLLIKVYSRAGEGGKLFGSISNKDIVDALVRDYGIEIDKKKIILKEPIKKLGFYSLPVKLYPSVHVNLSVNVLSDQ